MSIGMSILYGGPHTDTFIYFPPFLIPVRTCRDISPIGLGARRVYKPIIRYLAQWYMRTCTVPKLI